MSDRPSETASKERLRLWLRLLRVTREIEASLREDLRINFQTTLPRFDVMAALNRHRDGLKMSQLSAFLKVSNGNVTGIVDRLIDEGFVDRMPVPGDRRAWRVALTDAGHVEFQRQASAHEGWVNDLLSGLDAQEATDIAAKLAHNLREARDEA